ncbi:adenylate/guanylate cyclase domain-containing protein [Mycobacterium conspicuum]|uniref:Adenylate/guanylate cyclase domain-containing protein n=1 Tax=Mycobacterium conspicuum TaxID=44010 RepID=A0A1X1TT70_9MYCO|nr:adenylate/guanylate cyclase domain-containing protein [Mycobacterium conspicuum]ORV47588.1 cyclase [Mycobacterium conspicuum]BBZ41161.1 adenylate/guanylate cyclase domain-containing protein [Mycobacterium conspicuum]
MPRHPKTVRGYAIEYGIALAAAYFLAVVDVAAILVPLRGHTAMYFGEHNLVVVAVLVVLATAAVMVAGAFSLAPTLRWFLAGNIPTKDQREAAMRLAGRQTVILLVAWAFSAVVLMLINRTAGVSVLLPMLLGVLLGAPAAAGTGMLLAQRSLRPIMIAATRDATPRLAVPGVLARLVLMWFLFSALPVGVIATFIVLRSHGWLIPKSATLTVPILVVALAALILGLPTMMLTSRSISDPLDEIVEAMAQIEHGHLETHVGAYERSQIGRLQTGFNRMVTGLAERDRLRDLFGRYVGADVARRALEEGGAQLSGDVVEAAVLYIDLVGSTQLAESRPPQEVAEVLNDFFRIVVDAVDEHQGLINKFAGDAALAVFGAPLRMDDPASSALATARALGTKLRKLPVDFGIGVSAGRVFAGNIGAENRYEYTVIGDAVNEAARLADLAKTADSRILCSAAAIEHADDAERARWSERYSTVLRGRSEATQISAPLTS